MMQVQNTKILSVDKGREEHVCTQKLCYLEMPLRILLHIPSTFWEHILLKHKFLLRHQLCLRQSFQKATHKSLLLPLQKIIAKFM